LSQQTCYAVAQSDDKCLTEAAYKALQKHYRNLLTRGEKEMPTILPRATGKREKLAKSDAHNQLERLRKYEVTVLLFAKNPNVAFTNNRSERDLCMANKGINPMHTIQTALVGRAIGRGE